VVRERRRRRRRRRVGRRFDVAPLTLLRIPEPYDFALSTERFRAFGTDLSNLWHEGGLHRVAAGREVRIEPAPGGVDVEPLDAPIEPVVRHVLGLAFDLQAFERFASTHEHLRELEPRLRGFRPPLVPDPFEMLVGSIVSQQVSLFAAFAIRNRFVERFGERAEHAYAFPTRERVGNANDEELLALGFSRRKAEYVLGIARSDTDLGALGELPDDDVKARLVSIRGLGEWSADWFLARHLGRAEAWPAGDLVLRRVAEGLYRGETARDAGRHFAPFQNLSAHYLLLGLRTP
jgi:3-methyladenine DNA glycosylase/8-oxoguanine DNA glycosylase